MFETSLDAWYAWVGVALVSVMLFGIVVGLPATSPPEATTVADTVDTVATSPHEPRTGVTVQATEIRLDPHRVGLRTESGTAWAHFEYGPVTPVADGPLRPVLDGDSPESVFQDEAAFASAVEAASEAGDWRPAPRELVVTRVSWGETDAVLVG